MIKIDSQKTDFIQTTFHNGEILQKFQEKHKGVVARLTATSSRETNAVLYEDIMTASTLKLVSDHGSMRFFSLGYVKGDDRVTFFFQQMPGFCGAIHLVSVFTNLDLEERRIFIEDLLQAMGYTVLFLSIKSDRVDRIKIIEENGYIPYMEINNRRTKNDVKLFYKTLNYNL